MGAMMMVDRYVERAELVVRVVDAVLSSRTGTDPAMIERWVLTRTDAGSVWLFAVLNDQMLPKFVKVFPHEYKRVLGVARQPELPRIIPNAPEAGRQVVHG